MNSYRRFAACSMLLGFLATPFISHAVETTLCKTNELPVYSCKLKNAKIVSVCASPDAGRSYIDYRFGTRAKVELAYSANRSLPGHQFHRGEVVYANNSEDTIWFTNAEYRYSIYNPTRGGPGLTISRHGDQVGRIECSNNGRGATGDFVTASPFIVDHGTGDLTKFNQLWGKK
jgi:hypothetical protein